MTLAFDKLVGAGNDFIFLSSDSRIDTENLPDLTRKLCDRHFGIGADGLVFIEKLAGTLFKWHFYNSDGSSAEMCGNAARCSFQFIKKYFQINEAQMETLCGTVHGRVLSDTEVEVSWTLQNSILVEKSVELDSNRKVSGFFINSGVPHFVIFNPETYSQKELRLIQSHPAFGSTETNVTLLDNRRGQNLTRTFERGVRDFTLACGTGVIASAFVLQHQCNKEIYYLSAPGGDLQVKLNGPEVFLKGSAQIIFYGTVLHN